MLGRGNRRNAVKQLAHQRQFWGVALADDVPKRLLQSYDPIGSLGNEILVLLIDSTYELNRFACAVEKVSSRRFN